MECSPTVAESRELAVILTPSTILYTNHYYCTATILIYVYKKIIFMQIILLG